MTRKKSFKFFCLGLEGRGGLEETSPQGVLGHMEMWGDKGREGTPKNEKMGRRLLWMVPKVIAILVTVVI